MKLQPAPAQPDSGLMPASRSVPRLHGYSTEERDKAWGIDVRRGCLRAVKKSVARAEQGRKSKRQGLRN
jgi:hypothetical protein